MEVKPFKVDFNYTTEETGYIVVVAANPEHAKAGAEYILAKRIPSGNFECTTVAVLEEEETPTFN